MSRWRTPKGFSASTTALTTAGVEPMVAASPMPLAPERVHRRRRHRLVRHEERQILGARQRVVHQRARHELAVRVVDHLLEKRLRHALGDAAVHLPVDQQSG